MKRRTLPTAPDRSRQTPPFRRHPLAAAVSMALAAGPAGAATIIADGKNCTLIDAITAANTDTATGRCRAGNGADTIKLKYDVTLTAVDNDTDGPNGLPSVTSTITINGHGHTISRSNAEGTPELRLLHIADTGNLILKQVTLRNGFAYSGGALFNRGTVALADSTVSGNSAARGAAASNDYFSTLTLTHSIISSNSAQYDAGGLLNGNTLTLTNSTVSGNSAREGGGLVNNGTLTVTQSAILGNTATLKGGGLASDYGSRGITTLTNSTVSGNSASFGGGLYNRSTALTLINSTVSGNRVSYGGGLHSYAQPSGYGHHDSAFVQLTNTIVANTEGGPDCANGGASYFAHTGVNLIEDGSCGASSFPAGTDPKLGPLANNGGPTRTHALLKGSPAIDAIALGVGGCGTDITTDQRGVSRPQPAAGKCDIGSFELIKAPALSIKSILDFFDQAVKDRDLRGTGPGNSAKHRLRAVRHMLLAAGDFLKHHKTQRACRQLAEVREHIDTDGKLKRNEFVTGPAAPTLAMMIQDLRKQLGCKHKAHGRRHQHSDEDHED